MFAYVNCSPVHNVINSTDLSSGDADPTDPGSSPSDPDPGSGDPSEPPPPSATKTYFTCNVTTLGNTSAQRLSKREFENTLKDLLALINSGLYDSTVAGYVSKLPNDQVNGKEDTTLIYQSQVNGYESIAFYLGQKIAASSTYLNAMPGTSSCLTAATISDTCLTNFINGFGLKVFRRPLSSAELTTYKGYFNNSNYVAKADKITAVIAIFLQSPDFLYRIYDQGIAYSDINNTRILTNYELASKVSYLIAGTMPDQTLFNKAADGSISTAATLKSEVTRLLAKPSAKTTVDRFFLEWLKFDQFETFSNFPTATLAGISINGLPEAMTRDVTETINNVVFTQSGSFEDLMSTKTSYVYDNNLAQVYGISNPNGAANLGATRAGILTRAAFLARKPSSLTSPPKRGKFLLSNVLCGELGSPPPGAPTQVDPLQPNEFLTTRQRVDYLTVQNRSGQTVSNCIGCHSRMNPLGFVYENFDSLGRLRPNGQEIVKSSNGDTLPLNIDTTVSTKELTGSSTTIQGYLDLNQQLAHNSRALSCMTLSWFDFLQKRTPAVEDNCYMNEVLETIYGTDSTGQGSIKDMITQTVLSDRFKYWKY